MRKREQRGCASRAGACASDRGRTGTRHWQAWREVRGQGVAGGVRHGGQGGEAHSRGAAGGARPGKRGRQVCEQHWLDVGAEGGSGT